MSHGPHKTESTVSRAELKMKKIIELMLNVLKKNRPNGLRFLLKSSFFLMFEGSIVPSRVLDHWLSGTSALAGPLNLVNSICVSFF